MAPRSFVFVVGTLFLFASCLRGQPPSEQERKELIRAQNEFSFRIYREMQKTIGGSFVLSPFSIHNVLVAAYAGAEGRTAEEFRKALGASSRDRFISAYSSLCKDSKRRHSGVLESANAFWGEQTTEFNKAYVSLIQEQLVTDVFMVDFQNNSALTANKINTWVKDRTKGQIKNLLNPCGVSGETQCLITSAVSLKAAWQTPFLPEQTKDGIFHSPYGDVTVPMMRLPFHRFLYVKERGVSVLELPYKGNTIMMAVVLPDPGITLESVAGELNSGWLEATRKGMSYHRAEKVLLPRFGATSELQLHAILKKMGMVTAFGVHGDYSKMTPASAVRLAEVVHSATIVVDERGTEAAAATGAQFRTIGYVERFSFVADRPFIYLVYDQDGLILFSGQFSSP